MEQESPRTVVKGLLRGEQPVRPLLMPLTFALASRIDDVGLGNFVSNPTKIVNALQQIRGTLRVDGVTCYYDTYLESEALGGEVHWGPTGPELMVHPKFAHLDDLRARWGGGDDIVNQGRIPVVTEVLERLKILLRDEPALMVGITGPIKLAAELTGTPPEEISSKELIEFSAGITAALAKRFVEAGADVVFLQETLPPVANTEVWEWWRGLLEPVINVVRFYEAVPVLLANEAVTAPQLSKFVESGEDGVMGWTAPVLTELGSRSMTRVIAVPATVFAAGGAVHDSDIAQFRRMVSQVVVGVVTTTTDLPVKADLRQVARSLGEFRQVLRSVA